MKQLKKSHSICRVLTMLPLVSAVAVTTGFAAPANAGQFQPRMLQQPLNTHAPQKATLVKLPADLKVNFTLDTSSIRKSNPRCVQGCAWNFMIRGSVKNVGRGDFIPRSPNAQTLQLLGPDPRNVSRASLMMSWPFGRLNHGQTKNVSVYVQKQPGKAIEFAADYTMQIVFGPDSPGDRNRRNNQMTLHRNAVLSAISHHHSVTAVKQLNSKSIPMIHR